MSDGPPGYLDMSQFDDSPVSYGELGLPELGVSAFEPSDDEWLDLIEEALRSVDLADVAVSGFDDGIDFSHDAPWPAAHPGDPGDWDVSHWSGHGWLFHPENDHHHGDWQHEHPDDHRPEVEWHGHDGHESHGHDAPHHEADEPHHDDDW